MSERGPYSRVYWSVMDDRKFDGIREDVRLFGSWSLMLVVADMAWPAPAYVPPTVPKAAVKRLSDCELVDLLAGHRFRVRGLDAERGRRAEAGRVGGLASGRSRTVERPLNDRSPVPRTETNLDEKRRDETETRQPARDGLPNITAEAITFLEGVTGRSMQVAGDRQLTEYDRQIEDHGLRSVMAAYNRAAKTLPASPRPTARQLVWSAMRILEPMASVKDTDKADRAAEADADWQRRVERTRRANAELRGEPA